MLNNVKDPSLSPFASREARLRRRIRQRKQPVQARARATTEALIEATLQILVRQGYRQLTTTRVAARAGVSVGTLYQYFPDKRSLVTALKVRYFGLLVQSVGAAVAAGAEGASEPSPHPSIDDSIEALLRRALQALVGVKRAHLELTLALREPMAELGGQSFVHETLGQFAALLAPALARAYPGLPQVERRALVLVAAIEGALSYAVFEQPAWLEQPWLVDELLAIALGYLGGLEA